MKIIKKSVKAKPEIKKSLPVKGKVAVPSKGEASLRKVCSESVLKFETLSQPKGMTLVPASEKFDPEEILMQRRGSAGKREFVPREGREGEEEVEILENDEEDLGYDDQYDYEYDEEETELEEAEASDADEEEDVEEEDEVEEEEESSEDDEDDYRY